jgi:primosomal replication protein N
VTKGNKIELRGVLHHAPELRTTPGGQALLRLLVDCGAEPGGLLLDVVMAGEGARESAQRLKAGQAVAVCGMLVAVKRRLNSGIAFAGVEVVASAISPVELSDE